MMATVDRSTVDSRVEYRVVVPVPDGGWLAGLWPLSGLERLRLADDWRQMARRSCQAAGVPPLRRARLVAEVRPRRLELGLNVAEDVRPTLTAVAGGLVDAGVVANFAPGRHRAIVDERMVLGTLSGEHEPLLILHLWRWDGGTNA